MAANLTKPAGRPKGAKNKLTLVTEALEKKLVKSAGGLMLREAQEILETVAERAKNGDMTAAKLILDRILPVKRASEDLASGAMNIQINIVGTNNEDSTSSQTHSAEPGPADWQIRTTQSTGEEFAEYADSTGVQAGSS